MQMGEVPSCNMVGPGRTTRATLVQRLARLPQPHEVVDDELMATLEQVQQARLAVRTLEDIILLDQDHWQSAALGVQRITTTGEFLLLGEQLLARSEPLGSRHDFWKFQVGRLHSAIFVV